MQSSLQDLTDSFAFTQDWFLLEVERFSNSLICNTVKKSSQRPSLTLNIDSFEKISSNPHKLPLVPTTTHPLNHQITSSPITPTFFNKFNSSNLYIKRKNVDSILSPRSQDNLKKRYNLLDLSIAEVMRGENDRKKPEKKKVIVHEVKASDTLAGIALSYGIELSILKRSNKLWTNDSIHMHKYLYIPLDDSTIVSDKANIIEQEDELYTSLSYKKIV